MDLIYVEDSIRDHPRSQRVLSQFPKADIVPIDRYGEVFNPRAQNFRLQKQNPAIILAEKHGKKVLPTPPDYRIGASQNYYFSHFLNCLYDCRYCFLQGMYQSANYVFFVNSEDFQSEIDELRHQVQADTPSEQLCLFTGYDCDSLGMEGITHFAEEFLPFMAERPDTWFELRTKSINTKLLENRDALPNVIPAFTLTPDEIARETEHGAPSLERRLAKAKALGEAGWPLGLRLDPLIPWPNFSQIYENFSMQLERELQPDWIHSITLGPMRFPKAMYDKIRKLYPYDRLFALCELEKIGSQMTYPQEVEAELLQLVKGPLIRWVGEGRVFSQTDG